MKKIVKQKGLKYTEQREIVLSILLHAKEHLTAEEVYNEIKKRYKDSNIGIATVYRALSFLEEVDLITSITFGADGKKYESNSKSRKRYRARFLMNSCMILISCIFLYFWTHGSLSFCMDNHEKK